MDKPPNSKGGVERLWEKRWEYLAADAAKCVNISDIFAASSSAAGRSSDSTVSTLSSVHSQSRRTCTVRKPGVAAVGGDDSEEEDRKMQAQGQIAGLVMSSLSLAE